MACVFWPHLVLQLADTGGSLWGWIVCVRNRDEIWGEVEIKIKSRPKCVWTFFYRLYFSKRGQGFSLKWTSCQLSSSLTWPRQDPRLSFVFLFDLSRRPDSPINPVPVFHDCLLILRNVYSDKHVVFKDPILKNSWFLSLNPNLLNTDAVKYWGL